MRAAFWKIAPLWAGGIVAFLSSLAPCTPAAHGETVLYSFCSQNNCSDGAHPNGLVEDRSGNIYGTTYPGGAANNGVAFELSPSGNGTYAYSVIYNFCSLAQCADGSLPEGSLILDKAGNLYGTTEEGGPNGDGEVFELLPDGGRWRLKTLYGFCAKSVCKDGRFPFSGLTYSGAIRGAPYDRHSQLFGTTSQGGPADWGVAYGLRPGTNGWTEQVLYSFCAKHSCRDGAFPMAHLIEDPSGNLYGTTSQGGTLGGGTAFELSPGNTVWTETVLHSFCTGTCKEGSVPFGGLAMEASGALIGFANGGGIACADRDHGPCGVVYAIEPLGTASRYSVLYTFGAGGRGDDGANPAGTPVLDAAGDIFGTTTFGGSARAGVLFRLAGSGLRVLHTFGQSLGDGISPGEVVRDRAGRIFGTTSFGGTGTDSSGTAYAFAP